MTETPVGIFGLGLVGMALAERLIAAGRAVIGHDIAPERIALLDAAGGRGESAEAVWQAAPVFACVFDTDQLAALIEAGPPCDGRLFVSLSTCDPARMPALGTAAAAKGWRLVEAPISGTSRQLAAGEALFLLGGAEEDARTLAPLIEALGRGWHHLGPLGAGNRAKLAVNLVLGLNRAALAEGLVFARAQGLDPAAFLALLQDSAAASAVMATKGPKMVSDDFAPEGRVAQSAKDFALILETAASSGRALPFAELYRAMMRDCLEHDEGEFDNAAIIRAIARAFGEGETAEGGEAP